MIALLLALCGTLPDSVVPPPRSGLVRTVAAHSVVSPETSRATSGDSAPDSPLVLAPLGVGALDSNGELAPGAVRMPDPRERPRHPFVLGAAGALAGGLVGAGVGYSIGNQMRTDDEWNLEAFAGTIYGACFGSVVGATWGVVHERAPGRSGKTVLVPLLGGVVGAAMGVFVGASTESFPMAFLIMASSSSLGAMTFDAVAPSAPRPTTAFIPILEPQRTGLVLHTPF